MATKTFFFRIADWLSSTELFERPGRKIPGGWHLYEYFVDKGEELLHFQEEDLKKRNEELIIDFGGGGVFSIISTMPIDLVQDLKKGNWSVSRNFITLIHPTNFRKSIEFQFAFEKGNLKMLKKDVAGKIEFFGLFRKQKLES
uniref:hypothetical protein n=1 Tax=uncultured Draconibacterium sp. TaxID=1573823 RepID=UPI00321650EC